MFCVKCYSLCNMYRVTKTYKTRRWLSGKESTCSAGDSGVMGSVPRQEDPLGEEMARTGRVLLMVKRLPWTEEPGRLNLAPEHARDFYLLT